jgi:SAM-dependent methyltransferase
MDILNQFCDRRLSELMDFLGFVSIYGDEKRLRVYNRWMEAHARLFDDAVVIEAGAGFGAFSDLAQKLGARKVYAVEVNKHMIGVLREKFRDRKGIQIVWKDMIDFRPNEGRADVLIQDLYGSLLYDESLYVLEKLKYEVGTIFPNEACLKMAVLNADDFLDVTVTREVLNQLNGVLVSNLFEPYDGDYPYDVLSWSVDEGLVTHDISLAGIEGDLLVFSLEIRHDGEFVCAAYDCTNWALSWTPRVGDRFEFKFKRQGVFCDPYFKWLG